MSSFMFLRPWFLLGFIPVLFIGIYWWFRTQKQNDWQKICDPILLNYLQLNHFNGKWVSTWLCIIMSLIFMIIAMAGPCWQSKPTPIGQIQKPGMIVLDLSTHMLLDDITPSRLERAKFLIEDLLHSNHDMQWGLIVFSQMPFIVSPMTNDIQNILNFLPALSPNILPVGGYDVLSATKKAIQILEQAGFVYGKIIVISSRMPDESVLRFLKTSNKFDLVWIHDSPQLLKSAKINLIDIKHAPSYLKTWLSKGFYFSKKDTLSSNKVIQHKDSGKWFLFISMILIVMVFRRGWFLRLWV